jgi:hypothetical protein
MICIPDVMIDIPSLNKDQTRDLAVQQNSEETATDVNCLNQSSFDN